jgi:hypothetical protein
MINFHDSFSINDLKDAYKGHPAKALLTFNEKCDISLRKEVIIVEDPKNDWLAEQLLKIERHNMVLPFFRWRFDTDDRRQAEKIVSEKINQLSRTSQDGLESLSAKVENYVNLLAKNRLRDENVARRLDWGFLRYFAIIAGFPIFIAGFVANLIPFFVPKIICDRYIKDLRFYSSVFVGSFTVLYLFYFPVLLILGAIFAGWTGFFLALLVPLSGYFVLYYQENFWERIRTLSFNLKRIFYPTLISDLTFQRHTILEELDKVKV